jgi:predicted Zn-dependent protease
LNNRLVRRSKIVSTSRIVIRGLLVLVVVGLLWATYRSKLRNRPDYYWNRAQSALQADNLGLARVNLQSMVQKFPEDARGHRALASVLLTEAKLPDTAEGYARHPQALNLLVEAGRAGKDDLKLQKLIVASCLRGNRIPQAVSFANTVLKAEPNNADALFALAAQKADSREPEEALQLLDKLPPEEQKAFRVLGLKAQALQAHNPKDPRLAEVLSAISTRAREMTTEQLAAMPEGDFTTMQRILPASVAVSESSATAYTRADAALSVCEALAKVSGDRSKAAATMAAQISAVLTEKFFTPAAEADLAASRQQLSARMEKLLKPGAEAEKPDVMVAYEAALLAFNKADFATAVELLDKAIAQHQADQRARPELAQPLHLLAARALLGLSRPREAKVHLEALLEHKRTSGLAQLMLGAVAAAEGRQQDALTHFTVAERELGNTNPLLQISLTQTLLALSRWQDALPYLASLHDLVKTDNPEVKAWVQQQQLTDNRIHYQEARALLALKRQPEAQQHLAALRGTDLEPKGILLEAEYAVSKKQPAEADKLLAAGMEKFPEDSELLDRRLALLKQMGKKDEAEALMASVAAASPADLKLQLMLAREKSQAGKHDEALKLLADLQEKNPDAVPVMLMRADALIQAGRIDEANALAAKLHGTPASNTLGSLVETVAALKANDPNKAAEKLKAAGSVADNLQLRHLEGEVAAIRGDFPAAIAALGDSVRVTGLRNRAGPLLCYCVARLAAKEGPPAADRALAPVLAASPDEPFVLMAQADVLTMENRFHEALKLLDRMEEIEKESPVAPQLKATVLSRAGDLPAAIREVNRALGKDPVYVPSLALAAQLYYNAKDFARSIDHAKLGLTAAPSAWQLAVLKSEAEWSAGKQQDALATAQNLIQQQPELVEARRQLVNLQTRGKQYETALTSCRAAREKFKDDAVLTVQEAALLGQCGQAEAGEALARQFVGEPPDSGRAMALANAFAQLQQNERAIHWCETALSTARDTDKPAIHLFLGNLAMNENAARPDRKLLESARDHFTAVLKAAPTNFVAGNNLAWLLAVDFNQAADAVPIAEQVRGDAPASKLPVTFVDTLATVYRRAGQFEKATPLLEQALAAHPQEPVLKYHLGMTLGRLGQRRRLDEARQLLRESLQGGLSADQTKDAEQEMQRIEQSQLADLKAADAAADAKTAAALAAGKEREEAAAAKARAERELRSGAK